MVPSPEHGTSQTMTSHALEVDKWRASVHEYPMIDEDDDDAAAADDADGVSLL